MHFKIGIIGFGEVGHIFSSEIKPLIHGVWDKKLSNPTLSPSLLADAKSLQITAFDSLQELCTNCNLIICAVTAGNTLEVAKETSHYIGKDSYYIDVNSASPDTKKSASKYIEGAQAHYIDAGVMSSVPPYGLKVPIILGGTQAHYMNDILLTLGFQTKVVSDQVGIASAIKMCRSVMIKGLEALVIESYTSARAHGVEDYVLPTLVETFPQIDWTSQGNYFFRRVIQHGQRRSEEMYEAAAMVQDLGFDSALTQAVAKKHAFIAERARAGTFENLSHKESWQTYADHLLNNKH